MSPALVSRRTDILGVPFKMLAGSCVAAWASSRLERWEVADHWKWKAGTSKVACRKIDGGLGLSSISF
jgi:hypothetical protein